MDLQLSDILIFALYAITTVLLVVWARRSAEAANRSARAAEKSAEAAERSAVAADSLIAHGSGAVDWETAFDLAFVVGIVVPLARSGASKGE